jgi:hypothetical protein
VVLSRSLITPKAVNPNRVIDLACFGAVREDHRNGVDPQVRGFPAPLGDRLVFDLGEIAAAKGHTI